MDPGLMLGHHEEMPALKIREYTPIRPAGGGLVHATSFYHPERAVCKLKCNGWVIEPKRLTCGKCKAGVLLRVDPRTEERVR